MSPIQAVMSGVVSIIVYSLVMFGVYKIFQISGEVTEIKDLLREIRRNTEDFSQLSASRPQSPERLARAVQAASYPEALEIAALDPPK